MIRHQNEEMHHDAELQFMEDMARLPEDQIEAEFAFRSAIFAELKARAKEMGVA